MTDAQFLERCVLRGDRQALAEVVARHGPMVLAVCRRVLDDPHEVEDAFQATFLILARKAGSIRDRTVLASWLYGVAYRVATRARAVGARRRSRERPGIEEVVMRPGRDEGWREVGPALDEEIRCLPGKYRDAVVLCYLEGQTHEQAARRLGCPPGTVSTRLTWARRRLRERLVRRGLAPTTVLAGAVLSSEAAPAAVPDLLARSTIEAAARFAAGPEAVGMVPTAVLKLTEGVLKMMFLSKLKLAAGIVLAAVALAAGAGAVVQATLAAGRDEPKGDLAKLQGKWKGTAKDPDGESTVILEVQGREAKLVVVWPNGEENGIKATLQLDEAATPKELDFIGWERLPGSKNPPPAPFIYEIDGDTLKLCGGHNEASKRPKEFKEGGEGSDYSALIIMKRQKD